MTRIQSILNLKCPRCREGDLFHTPTFSFRQPMAMPKHCPHCNQNLHPEPGFYYGAMFIGYIMTAGFAIVFIMLLHWVIGLSTNVSFLILIAIFAIFFIYLFRLARSVWIHMVVKYDAERSKAE